MSEAPDSERNDEGQISRVFQPRRALPTDVVRPTRAEVRLGHLRHNLGVLRKVCGPVPIWGVLKADAYGHGSKGVARTLERAGMDGICVALVEEGVELREAGLECPILVMGGYYGPAYRELAHFRLTPVLQDAEQVRAICEAAAHDAQPLEVHLKVDTGMSRLGARADDWADFARALADAPALRLQALMSHFASADLCDPGPLAEALRQFARAKETFAEQGVAVPRSHIANSAAALRSRASHFDLVRPGIALFGEDPLEPGAAHIASASEVGQLRPVMSLHSRIVALRQLRPGDCVGYGARFVAKRPTAIATVPMGYADGLSRAMSTQGSMLVRGQRAPLAGTISMDMVTLDVTDIEGASVGDEVVLLGEQRFGQHSDAITATELARWSGTIAWEVLTNISRRVPRFYLQD